MRTSTSNDITRTETLSDADLEQVAGGFFCVTLPVIGLPVFPPVTLPTPVRPGAGGPDPIPPRFPPLPTGRTSPVTDAESMLPDLLWDAQ